MIWVLAVYIIVGLLFARAATFENQKPIDSVGAFFLWPFIFASVAWRVWTRQIQMTFRWHNKVVWKSAPARTHWRV